MNCPKTMTNGRISLTKQLHFTQKSPAPFTHQSQSTGTPLSVLSAVFSPFESTEMPYFVLSTARLESESTETPDSVLSKANFNDESTKPDDFVLSKFIYGQLGFTDGKCAPRVHSDGHRFLHIHGQSARCC
jgi:hypothetical protein